MESNSTAFLIKIKPRHSLGRPSRSDFVQSEFVEESNLLVLNKLERLLTVCKVKYIDDIDLSKEFYFIGKTDEEISLVCETNDVPENTIEREDGGVVSVFKEFWIFHSLAFFQSCLEYLQIIKLEF